MKFSLFLGCTVALLSIANTAVAKAPSPANPIAQTQLAANPQTADEYVDSAQAKEKNNDLQGALADYNRAIAIDAKSIKAYIFRATLKGFKLEDFRGSIADFTKAIELNPELDVAYAGRGVIKGYKLNDREGGIKDLRIAAKLLRAQGDTEHLELVLGAIKDLGGTE
jgi:tetratricopeptide (TPR) repeat protein